MIWIWIAIAAYGLLNAAAMAAIIMPRPRRRG